MNFFDFGREQLENGSLNGMLQEVGISDVRPFLNQFRDRVKQEAPQNDEDSTDESNVYSGGQNAGNMFQGAMKAYEAFSGGQGGGVGSTIQNAQKMYEMYKQFDKNGDGKIAEVDIQLYLQELGLGGASAYLAKGIFQAVDQNHNGALDFTDLMALATMLNKLYGRFGNVA
ncbi:unnamed protein product [Rotaria magnacalcarata]|uniref:EF-hand domain-containing protein n=2 Tax=Rotaria magnacalcarata TaxID=392030 RepID=A0A819JCW6_9BILA|nr:unnamed protein product [Rotaria magnacalcarata]